MVPLAAVAETTHKRTPLAVMVELILAVVVVVVLITLLGPKVVMVVLA